MGQIGKVPEAIKQRIRNKSVLNLPNNPSERGFTPEELKRRFANTVVDTDMANAIAQIDRIVDEINAENEKLDARAKGKIVPFTADKWNVSSDGRRYLEITKSECGIENPYVDKMLIEVNDGSGEIYVAEADCDARYLPITEKLIVFVDVSLTADSWYNGKIIVKGE